MGDPLSMELLTARQRDAAKANPGGRLLAVDCGDHGRIWIVAVWCRHDTEEEVRAVSDAHRAHYGANCRAVLAVTIIDPETPEPVDG